MSLSSDTGGPQVLRVSVPQPGVPRDLTMGQLVKATGWTLIAGETNGRAWQMFRATALTLAKALRGGGVVDLVRHWNVSDGPPSFR